MKQTTQFFVVFVAIYYTQLALLVKMVIEGLCLYKIDSPAYKDVKFTANYALLQWIFEFYSIAKYCVTFEVEGLVQLVPLKVFRYLCFFASIFEKEIHIYRTLYLCLDIVFVFLFFIFKDSTLEIVLHNYNLKIGTDVKVRNAFIVSDKLI
ncbi:hypothetical protein NGRA_1590 [Nosema granulosis]|uniref:Uncharacterized protein n=1 Tax=Nosema granulosis TaxID=83296 RepID=A0A9P6GYM9_9MICR|nr:hypothetical protein NGRA_1590 [Nosema granulosis]